MNEENLNALAGAVGEFVDQHHRTESRVGALELICRCLCLAHPSLSLVAGEARQGAIDLQPAFVSDPLGREAFNSVIHDFLRVADPDGPPFAPPPA